MSNSRRYGINVLINYQGRFPDGTIFDDRSKGEPLEVMLGTRSLPLGIEEALHEMEPGEERTLALTPDRAFGQIDAEGIMELPRFSVPQAHDLEAGMMIEWYSPKALKTVHVMVAAITAATVTLDFNHPLAGEDVVYWVRLVDIVHKGTT